MLHLIPAPIHRALLPWAHRIRRRWRRIRKAPLRGVSVIITDNLEQVLLLRHSYGAPVWALPGGGLSASEDPAEGARREVLEELGMQLDQLELLGELEEVISASAHTAYIFAATSGEPPKPDKREVLDARFFALDAVPENISALTRRRLDLLRSKQR